MHDMFKAPRNSSLELNEVYFWTSTVKDWKRQLIVVYGFVIMPNLIHLIWELKNMNGKEKPHASFNKATAHVMRIDLMANHPLQLKEFKVDKTERQYRIWQRDPLAILLDSKEKFEQKLDYIHCNPLKEKWNLAERPEDYKWSSASYYEKGVSSFSFLTHYHDRF